MDVLFFCVFVLCLYFLAEVLEKKRVRNVGGFAYREDVFRHLLEKEGFSGCELDGSLC